MEKEKTLVYWQDEIEAEIPYIDIKPYSHNIIGICLSAIAKKFGKDKANATIDMFELEDYGWSKE